MQLRSPTTSSLLNNLKSAIPIVALLMLLPLQAAQAIITSDASGTHVVDDGFAFGEDLSGVASLGVRIASPDTGSIETVPICSGALISDRHIISAVHCLGGFYFIEDLFASFSDSPPFELTPEVRFATAEGEVRIPIDVESAVYDPIWPDVDIDLMVIALQETPPESVARYPIYSGRMELGEQVVVAGFGSPGFGATGREPDEITDGFEVEKPLRAGLNRLEDIELDESGEIEFLAFDFDSGLPENNTLELFGTSSDLGFGADEVGFGDGDSGGPVLSNGVIHGVGIALSGNPDIGDVTPEADGSWGELGLVLRTSNHIEFIAEATNGEVTFVPETSSNRLLMFGLLFFLRRLARR